MIDSKREGGRTPVAGKADPEQYARFLETARELGLDPTDDADTSRVDEVVRRAAKLPSQRREPAGPAGRPGDGDPHG